MNYPNPTLGVSTRNLDSPDSGSARMCTQPQSATTATPPGLNIGLPEAATVAEFDVCLDLVLAGPTDLTIRYECVGPTQAPIIVVLGGISATRHVTVHHQNPTPGWWQVHTQPGGPLDATQHRILSIDWIGGDGSLDVPLDPADQARALHLALKAIHGIAFADDTTSIPAVKAIVGASYGAMVCLHAAVQHPRTYPRVVLMSGCHRSHPFSTAWRTIQRAILSLPGEGADPSPALALARQLALLSYRTPADIASRSTEEALAWLQQRGEEFTTRFTPTAFLRLSESIDNHRINPADVTSRVAAIAVADDLLVPEADMADLVTQLNDAHLTTFSSDYGHDGFLKEPDHVSLALTEALTHVCA